MHLYIFKVYEAAIAQWYLKISMVIQLCMYISLRLIEQLQHSGI